MAEAGGRELFVQLEDRRRGQASITPVDGFETCPCAIAIATRKRGFSVGQLRQKLPLDASIAKGQLPGVHRGALVERFERAVK